MKCHDRAVWHFPSGNAGAYMTGMDGFLMTIGVFLLIATLVFVVVELWPMAPTKPSGTRGQEDEEPHFHFDDPTGTGRHAPV